MHRQDRNTLALTILRVTLATLIAIHGWHRFLSGDVADFGHGLDHRGYPFGMLLAWTITGLEMIGAVVFALGRCVFPLSVVYIFLYGTAILIYHLPHGWFSSGTDVDGCEYAVLLVAGFVCTALSHAPTLGMLRTGATRHP